MKRCLQCATAFESDGWTCPACNFAPASVAGCLAFAPELAGGGEGYQDSYFDELARLEAANFWFGGRNELIPWALRKHFKGVQNFLEIGCGTGFVLSGIAQAFPQMTLCGSEVSTNGLAHAAQRKTQEDFDALAELRLGPVANFALKSILDLERGLIRAGAWFPFGGSLLVVAQKPFH